MVKIFSQNIFEWNNIKSHSFRSLLPCEIYFLIFLFFFSQKWYFSLKCWTIWIYQMYIQFDLHIFVVQISIGLFWFIDLKHVESWGFLKTIISRWSLYCVMFSFRRLGGSNRRISPESLVHILHTFYKGR